MNGSLREHANDESPDLQADGVQGLLDRPELGCGIKLNQALEAGWPLWNATCAQIGTRETGGLT